MAAKKKFRVTRGNAHISVYPYRHSSGREYWRFAWRRNTGEPWQTVQKTLKEEARQAAWDILGDIQTGEIEWSSLPDDRQRWLMEIHRQATPGDQEALLAFLLARRRSGDIREAVSRFVASKIEAKGQKTDHLAQIERDLTDMAKAFPGKLVSDVAVADLSTWWDLRTGKAGRERRKGIRGTLVSFWNWAQKDGLTGSDPVTVAERLPTIHLDGGGLRIYSPAEAAFIFGNAKRDFLACFVLGAFAGIRPEELAPKAPKQGQKAKPGLRWEHIDWKFDVIRIPRDVAKTRRARIVPLLPAAKAWLQAMGADESWRGSVCVENPADAGETLRLGKLMDSHFKRKEGWPKDALRHSYASYRNATIRSLGQVAEEMGTSEDMLHRHYHFPRTEEEGLAWFEIRPLGEAIAKAS